MTQPRLDGVKRLVPKTRSILLDKLAVQADIGFHDFEIGTPQRIFITVELWMDEADVDFADDPDKAWNYDFLRTEILRIAGTRRWNLQETLAREIFDRIGAMNGVKALRVASGKPDIYADADYVGIEFRSF